MLANIFIWLGIALYITQYAIFSGLNLAIFSISKLRLEIEATGGSRDAAGLLALRKDSNLSDSVLASIEAFAFSTIVITLFGDISREMRLLNIYRIGFFR